LLQAGYSLIVQAEQMLVENILLKIITKAEELFVKPGTEVQRCKLKFGSPVSLAAILLLAVRCSHDKFFIC
jgi:hypothetical protein